MRPVRWRPLARSDAIAAAAWYAQQGGLGLELDFIAALQAAVELVAANPAAGSPRHAHLFPELAAPLRVVALHRFERWQMYYLGHEDDIEIVRIWHSARDLAALDADADADDDDD